MSKKLDLTGRRYGRLTVLYEAPKKSGRIAWFCKCDCGGTKIATSNKLQLRECRSCGCLMYEARYCTHTIHGDSGKTHENGKRKSTQLYHTWSGMKQRCINSNSSNYHNYGGRGITMYGQWNISFISFKEWAISNGYKKGLTIDRIDNNGNYEPSNCRWVSNSVQAWNKRITVYLEYDGKRLNMKEWSKLTGLTISQITNRRKSGWSVKKILTTPRLTSRGRIA